MFQKWRDLLFLHWEIEASTIQKGLLSGCSVDSYEGGAFLGVAKESEKRFQSLAGSLGYFLIERYVLYAVDSAGVSTAISEVHECGVFHLAGFEIKESLPDHIMMSRGVDVEVFGLERCSS